MGMTAPQWPTRRGWSKGPRLWRALTTRLLSKSGNMARAEDGLSEMDEGLSETLGWSSLCITICTLMAMDGTKSVIAALCILAIDHIGMFAYLQYIKDS